MDNVLGLDEKPIVYDGVELNAIENLKESIQPDIIIKHGIYTGTNVDKFRASMKKFEIGVMVATTGSYTYDTFTNGCHFYNDTLKTLLFKNNCYQNQSFNIIDTHSEYYTKWNKIRTMQFVRDDDSFEHEYEYLCVNKGVTIDSTKYTYTKYFVDLTNEITTDWGVYDTIEKCYIPGVQDISYLANDSNYTTVKNLYAPDATIGNGMFQNGHNPYYNIPTNFENLYLPKLKTYNSNEIDTSASESTYYLTMLMEHGNKVYMPYVGVRMKANGTLTNSTIANLICSDCTIDNCKMIACNSTGSVYEYEHGIGGCTITNSYIEGGLKDQYSEHKFLSQISECTITNCILRKVYVSNCVIDGVTVDSKIYY